VQRIGPRVVAWVGAVVMLAVAYASPAFADESPAWTPGSNWMIVRGGIAESNAQGSGEGGAGYGFGFRHMLTPLKLNEWQVAGVRPFSFLKWTLLKKFSVAGFVDYNVISRFGSASEIEIPATVELTRHFGAKGAARPYFSGGFGSFHRKTTNTGNDFSRTVVCGFIDGGVDMSVASNQLLGVDVRFARVDGENPNNNPVFGTGESSATHWSVKLGYAIQY
jgi:hypothetical protein